MGIKKYISRIKESGRTIRRHSSFFIGLLVAELLILNPNKRKSYQQGERAMRLILSARLAQVVAP
ncbi:hypothetical protein A6769_28610 [Nostoc punctiforme NIES-2108]|uniref:Transposase n=1 Tax=Nostoc punctiforme NIES-2108 TaxID=1356359 RepID=A0A367RAB9_NOSPU|nr:hypothetical protein A6769_28610 [Nostoc punctiforme NIES-2108]